MQEPQPTETGAGAQFSKQLSETVMSPESQQNPSSLQEFNWLSQHAPAFAVDGDKITVIKDPKDFYQTLMMKIKEADSRIILSSLYLGTGVLEQELVHSLQSTLERSKGSLELLVLLDASRGCRGSPNSCQVLLPLLQDGRTNVHVALYHTPSLRGLLKRLVPHRWNELVGLQHMKSYVIDDTVIISGANLSNDYFSDRQDRYMMIEDCPQLASYLHQLSATVSSFSFQLMSDGNMVLHPQCKIHPYLGDDKKFISMARQRVLEILESSWHSSWKQQFIEEGNNINKHATDTLVFPMVQMGVLGITQDEMATRALLSYTPSSANITLATGYFNLTQAYSELILHKNSKSNISILMASPQANGFYKGAGVSGAIPDAYSHMAHLFWKQVLQKHVQRRVQLLEYDRPGFTFHAKGLWFRPNHQSFPTLTTIGSPNFGYRSVSRDLELHLVIVTENQNLQRQLHKEQQYLTSSAVPVDNAVFGQRSIPLWVRLVTIFFRDFF